MREGMVARFQAILRAATAAACLSASVAVACPFCGVVGQSLAERRDEADVVAVGEECAPALLVVEVRDDGAGIAAEHVITSAWGPRR